MGLRRGVAVLASVAVLGAGAAGPAGAGDDPADEGGGAEAAAGPVAPLGVEGTWFVDAEGRVVLLHGVNEVYKHAPYHPAADDFGEADARFLADHGFNVVRLGVNFGALMPEPGVLDHDYVENLATTVDDLAEERIFVVLDFHQDGYGPAYGGGGFPEWMSIDDGVDNNLEAEFPLYYIENPAMQRAFRNFWANREAEDGTGLQDHFVDGLTAVVERFADDPYVVGYELMNEPWPGETWEPCLDPETSGCPGLERDLLVPFYERATAAVREVTRTQQVWVEPFVLFNFGQAPTSLPGAGSDNVLAWHSYALDVAGEEAVVAHAREASERDGVPAVATEFGATDDVETVNRLLDQIEGGLMGWMFWAYNENVAGYGSRRDDVPRIEQVHDLDLFTALVRPYPTALTGTPTGSCFDPETLAYELTYDTAGPDGRDYPAGLESTVEVPSLRYSGGYEVEVAGATVTSEPGAPVLTLENDGPAEVTLRIGPAGEPVEAGCGGDGGSDGGGPGDGSDGDGSLAPPATPVRGAPGFTG